MTKKNLNKIISKTFSINYNKVNNKLGINKIPQWDSIGHMNLFFAIEKEFKIKFDPEDIISNLDYNSILSTLEVYLDEKNQ
jgi:acyl carrier protein